jgi:hypothetical protein
VDGDRNVACKCVVITSKETCLTGLQIQQYLKCERRVVKRIGLAIASDGNWCPCCRRDASSLLSRDGGEGDLTLNLSD